MSGALNALKEWINPAWGRHRIVPPLERGLRPNLRLDEAAELLPEGAYVPDDVAVTTTGALLFSAGDRIHQLRGGSVELLAVLGGQVAALAADGDRVVAAVDGRGLVAVTPTGHVDELTTATEVTSCVTDLAVAPDGALLVTVGSRHLSAAGWARALLEGDRTGSIVRVAGGRAEVVAERLAWPSGICVTDDGDVLVALSLEHRVERRHLDALSRAGRTVTSDLPVYPGRVRRDGDGFWVTAPYIRNRVTEMVLDERNLVAEMVSTISPDEWFVPRLRAGNPFTDTMQMGQLRIFGVVKSWAPARSCGLVFRIDTAGRVVESAHARVDSLRHGVTGVAVHDGDLIVAAQGHGNLLKLEAQA